ncbi:MAG: hypothetical protein ACREPK_11455, partial [Rhodanobacteraceae bacterium]
SSARPPFDAHRREIERTRCSFDHCHGRDGFWPLFAETKSGSLTAEASETPTSASRTRER